MSSIPKIPSSEITARHIYLSRRKFIQAMGLSAGAAALAACGITPADSPSPSPTGESGGRVIPPTAGTATTPAEASPSALVDELGDPANSEAEITSFNNYYEFSIDKEAVASMAAGYPTVPWQVEVGGLVNNPGIYDLDALNQFDQEERIYRLRCVEGWSMVIPWIGFPLRKLLEKVDPTAEAKYVRFETIYDPERMPGQRSAWYQWPYVEGLRLDEAMNDLAILATGLYGESLPMQNGAPVRLVVPWKYGFKSIKSIVRIDLVTEQPTSLWMAAAPHEYGFYANVNPDVSHPRWSQRTERRIGELRRRETLPFNGYGEQVASLYSGMDLRANY